MKRLFIFFIISLISVFSFASCASFQLANDCNGNSTTLIARNDGVTMNVHGNWNQGRATYKFQSGPDQLTFDVYSNDLSKLYTVISYKSKSAKVYYDFNLGQMSSDDYEALYQVLSSVPSAFFAQIELLADQMPDYTSNLQTLRDFASALLSHEPVTVNGVITWYQYLVCTITKAVGCYTETNFDECFDKVEKECHDKY